MPKADRAPSTPQKRLPDTLTVGTLSSLAEKFATAYEQIAALLPAYNAAIDRRDREIARRTGIEPHWGFRSELETTRHIAELGRVEKEMGLVQLFKKVEALYGRLDPIVRAITDAPAQDLAGLALKANALATTMPSLWEEAPHELDCEQLLVRDLIENICGVAGVNLAAIKTARPRDDLN